MAMPDSRLLCQVWSQVPFSWCGPCTVGYSLHTDEAALKRFTPGHLELNRKLRGATFAACGQPYQLDTVSVLPEIRAQVLAVDGLFFPGPTVLYRPILIPDDALAS